MAGSPTRPDASCVRASGARHAFGAARGATGWRRDARRPRLFWWSQDRGTCLGAAASEFGRASRPLRAPRARQVRGSEGRDYRGRTKGGLWRSRLRMVPRLQQPAFGVGAHSRLVSSDHVVTIAPTGACAGEGGAMVLGEQETRRERLVETCSDARGISVGGKQSSAGGPPPLMLFVLVKTGRFSTDCVDL